MGRVFVRLKVVNGGEMGRWRVLRWGRFPVAMKNGSGGFRVWWWFTVIEGGGLKGDGAR